MPDFESLRSPVDFRRALKEGKRYRSGGLVLVAAPGVPGPPRVGLVVSKAAGKAVTRNRVKRRLRHTAGAVPLKPGNDYVIIATSQVATIPYAELVGWVERALERADRD